MKKIVITLIIIFIIIIAIPVIAYVFFYDELCINNYFEIYIPIFTQKVKYEIDSSKYNFFDEDRLIIKELTDKQTNNLLNEILSNENWHSLPLLEELDEKVKDRTRDEIYNKIPEISNGYWVFTSSGHGLENKHDVNEMLLKNYYAINIGILDIDNNKFYYYYYDR